MPCHQQSISHVILRAVYTKEEQKFIKDFFRWFGNFLPKTKAKLFFDSFLRNSTMLCSVCSENRSEKAKVSNNNCFESDKRFKSLDINQVKAKRHTQDLKLMRQHKVFYTFARLNGRKDRNKKNGFWKLISCHFHSQRKKFFPFLFFGKT